jgi:hypothetical protein
VHPLSAHLRMATDSLMGEEQKLAEDNPSTEEAPQSYVRNNVYFGSPQQNKNPQDQQCLDEHQYQCNRPSGKESFKVKPGKIRTTSLNETKQFVFSDYLN